MTNLLDARSAFLQKADDQTPKQLTKLVMDSSVFLKQFFDEEDQEKTIDFLGKILALKTLIFVPEIFYYEVLSAAVKKKDSGFYQILEILEDYKNATLHMISPTFEIIKKAKELTEVGHEKSGFPSFYDSVYHAMAILNNCDFITADKKHYEKAKKFGHIKLLKDAFQA